MHMEREKKKKNWEGCMLGVGGLPFCNMFPLLIVNRYVGFHFNAYHSLYWENCIFRKKNASKKREITQIKWWIELSSLVQQNGVNTFYKCIECQVNSFDSYWEILIILKKYPKFLCTMSKQGQITLDIQITGSPALL